MVIFEIFTEEIPATLQKNIVQNYKLFVEKNFLSKEKIIVNSFDIGVTLNRLVLILDAKTEIKESLLKEFVKVTLKEFSATFPRTMHYPQLDCQWIRPIRNIFACIDEKIIVGNFLGIEAKKGIYIEKTKFYKCNNAKEYLNLLKKNEIEISYEKRLNFVKKNISKYVECFENYEGLAEEIAGMDECLVETTKCKLDKKFNVLPFELIKLVLQKNQRYVVYKTNNNDIEYLIFCGKIVQKKGKKDLVIKGHKKVVNARLQDAMYYLNLDKKEQGTNDEKYKENLKKILLSKMFINDISWKSYLNLQCELVDYFIDDKYKEKIKQFVFDTKIDLVTNVVNEFPELQGIIGSIYFKYNFNPYMIGEVKNFNGDIIILYYYLIDRLSYISKMYELGNQPTGRGDKFKVKKRMDDVISILNNKHIDVKVKDKVLNYIKDKAYYSLFLKRSSSEI